MYEIRDYEFPPSQSQSKYKDIYETMQALKPGQSFVVPREDAPVRSALSTVYLKARMLQIKIRIKVQPDRSLLFIRVA